MVIYIRYGLRGPLQENTRVVRYNHPVRVENTTRVKELRFCVYCPVPRQLCSAHFATFAEPNTAGCDLKLESSVVCRSRFSLLAA